jgi:hypothetical protein
VSAARTVAATLRATARRAAALARTRALPPPSPVPAVPVLPRGPAASLWTHFPLPRPRPRPCRAPAAPAARRGMSGDPPALDADRMLAAAADYVDMSNKGDVAGCLAMFAPDAVYGSTTVGGHQGLEAISAMMVGGACACSRARAHQA